LGKKKGTKLYLSEDLVKKARIKAILEGTSVSRVVEDFLKKWVENG